MTGSKEENQKRTKDTIESTIMKNKRGTAYAQSWYVV